MKYLFDFYLKSELNLKNYVKKNEVIIRLKDKDLIAPFSGILGYRGLTEDVLGTDNTIIITLDDSSIIYADLKIPESFASKIKKGLLGFSHLQLGSFRLVISALIIFVFGFKSLKGLNKNQWKWLALSGFLGSFFPSFLFAYAETEVDSTITSLSLIHI